MSAQLTDEEALNRVASYCSAAEHCRAEVNEKLQRWGIAYETIARILERLETEKYIDDERYCRAFVNDKFSFAKCSFVNGLSLLIMMTTLSAPLRTKICIRRSIMATPFSCTKGLGKATPSCESREPSPADIIANFISTLFLEIIF